jgi:ribose transport system substrate-binding protein
MVGRRHRSFWLTAVLALGICGAAGVAVAVNASSSAAASTAKTKFTIGVVLQTGAQAGQEQFLAGLKAEATKLGYAVRSADSELDVAKANELTQTFVGEKVNAIVVEVVDPTQMKAGIAAANAAHIPIYFYYAYGKPKGVAMVSSLAAGAQEATLMAKSMHGKGNVLAFTFTPSQPCAVSEVSFNKVMKSYPNIHVEKHETVAPGWQADGQSTTALWLTAHPAGSGALAIWGCWDGPVEGAASALRAANRHDVKAYGDFAEPAGLEAIKAGWMTATYWFDNQSEGKVMAEQIHTNAGKAHITATYRSVPSILVDQANIKAFLKKYPAAMAT